MSDSNVNEYQKEIEFALTSGLYEVLTDALNDAISSQARYGNYAIARKYGKLQEALQVQKNGQDSTLKQAKQILKVK